ncbi:hypothetical protein ACSBR2_038340 [Camellia fascicularis]
MFNSDEWKNSRWGKAKTGQPYKVKKIILEKEFWQKATKLCKVYEPLVRVLRLVDGDEKPTMGFIYQAIDRAKLAIKRDCRYYTEYWKIIDTRWSFQLHQDLFRGSDTHRNERRLRSREQQLDSSDSNQSYPYHPYPSYSSDSQNYPYPSQRNYPLPPQQHGLLGYGLPNYLQAQEEYVDPFQPRNPFSPPMHQTEKDDMMSTFTYIFPTGWGEGSSNQAQQSESQDAPHHSF